MSQRFILNKNKHLFRKTFKKNIINRFLSKDNKKLENDKKSFKISRKKEKKDIDIPTINIVDSNDTMEINKE